MTSDKKHCLSYLELPSKLIKTKEKVDDNTINKNNTINTSFNLKRRRNRKKTILSQKYSNNYVKNAICKTILTNPN